MFDGVEPAVTEVVLPIRPITDVMFPVSPLPDAFFPTPQQAEPVRGCLQTHRETRLYQAPSQWEIIVSIR
jgi:hypothetical protein